MKTTKSRQLYDKACKELALINKTLTGMDNDSVSFLICHEIKECMSDFLQCYLLIKKGKQTRLKNIADMFNESAKLDARLKSVDLRWINCKDLNLKTEADEFCASTQRVQVCAIITNGLKRLVDEEMAKIEVATVH